MVPVSALFSKALQCYSDLAHVCATQWPEQDLGVGLSHSRIVKAFGMLSGFMHAQLESKERM